MTVLSIPAPAPVAATVATIEPQLRIVNNLYGLGFVTDSLCFVNGSSIPTEPSANDADAHAPVQAVAGHQTYNEDANTINVDLGNSNNENVGDEESTIIKDITVVVSPSGTSEEEATQVPTSQEDASDIAWIRNECVTLNVDGESRTFELGYLVGSSNQKQGEVNWPMLVARLEEVMRADGIEERSIQRSIGFIQPNIGRAKKSVAQENLQHPIPGLS
ncbi:hypothetical protein BDN70DRAFT_992038 [Pholiota conissans]|uniref:Uncharacterized protein n=1 Tax=Pholiota conissans TaxID=109636 RepID=A0A9P5Z507_9AGAR|nr:hypothetical protein BDN70DRAFT_992038 [Pholiota conissans]